MVGINGDDELCVFSESLTPKDLYYPDQFDQLNKQNGGCGLCFYVFCINIDDIFEMIRMFFFESLEIERTFQYAILQLNEDVFYGVYLVEVKIENNIKSDFHRNFSTQYFNFLSFSRSTKIILISIGLLVDD